MAITQIKQIGTTTVDPRKEYVSGGGYGWLENYRRTLPHYIDDLTRDFGPDLYERMMLDAEVSSAASVVKLAILAQGVKLVNPKAQDDPQYQAGQDMVEFVQRNFDRLDHPFEETLYELLDAMCIGVKIAEKVYELSVEGEDKGRLMLERIKIKSRKTVAILVDQYTNIKGVVGLKPGMMNTLGQADGMLINGAKISDQIKILPREKFIIFSYRPKDGDPRGTSILRPAYNAWWLKTQVWPEYLKYLAQFAGPSLLGFTPEGAENNVLSDQFGNPILDEAGESQQATPEQLMLTNLLAFHNGTAAVFPYGAVVQPLEMQGNGEAFRLALDALNQEITKAILYQTLATGEGQFMARAASETHQDVLDLIIRYGKLSLAHIIETDIVRDLIRYNFGEEQARTLAPQVVLPNTEIQDFAQNAAAIGTLMSVDYLADDQMAETDAKLGLKVRDMDKWQKQREEKRQAEITKLTSSAQPPGGKPVRPKGGVSSGITDPDSRG